MCFQTGCYSQETCGPLASLERYKRWNWFWTWWLAPKMDLKVKLWNQSDLYSIFCDVMCPMWRWNISQLRRKQLDSYQNGATCRKPFHWRWDIIQIQIYKDMQNHNMKNTRTPRRCLCFFWALPLLLTLYLPEILVKGFFFKILSPTFALSLKHGHIYSKNIHLKYFLKQYPLFFTFSRKPGDWRPIVHTSVEAACLCWPGAVNCCLFELLFAFYFVNFVWFVYFVCTLLTFSLTRCCSLLLVFVPF